MKKIFLLGGHDLEMLEIRNILQEKNIPYIDENLDWSNAVLSAYQEALWKYKEYEIIGIEIRSDMEEPDKYKRIDHHNEMQHGFSAIEQVAQLLNYKLNRYQQLVAANDTGYIPAMQAMRATEQEINEIRQWDRKAQGVTPEEEQEALRAIQNMKTIGDLQIIETLSNHFSPICDRLFPFRNLLIYNLKTLTYYGYKKPYYVDLFKDKIECGMIYHGGGNNGFIGVAKGVVTPQELNEIKNRIISQN